MANRSYLAVTNTDTIYPSNAESDFTPEEQTVAQGVYCVPILWFGLFRPSNMRAQKFDVDGDLVTGVAPVVDVPTALTQLNDAVAKLNKMFEKQGSFDDYAALLGEAIRSTGRKYVTIEMEEIACMGDPDEFYEDVKEALRAFTGEAALKVGSDKLVKISEIPTNVTFPTARCLLGDQKTSDEAIDALSRIIGCSYIRKVPWE
jgi:hypothetical protein